MDRLTNIVESLWDFVISTIWRLWICFAVIVFVHVKFGVSSLSLATPEGDNTKATKRCRSASVRKIIKTAKKLMRLNKLDDANEILNQGAPFFEDEFENRASELSEHRFWAGCLHEIRSLCLYRKGDVIGSMVEIDRGVAVVQRLDSHLLSSANHCFQLFHKWCCENIESFQQEIVMYFRDKKKRLETGAFQKIANTSLLLESIHCLILSELLVRCSNVDPKESTELKNLCQHFYGLLKSEKGDDQILNCFSHSPSESLAVRISTNEIEYDDLVKQTEKRPILKEVQKISGSENPEFVQQSENSVNLEVEGPHELETVANGSKYVEILGEAYLRSPAEVEDIEVLQHGGTKAETLELILDSCGSDSRELMQNYDSPRKPNVVSESVETGNTQVLQQVIEASKVPSKTTNDFVVWKHEAMASDSNGRSNDTNSVTLNAIVEKYAPEDDRVETDKSEEEVECGESRDAGTEFSTSENGVEAGILADGEVEPGTSEDSEVEHGKCGSDDGELGRSEDEVECDESGIEDESGRLPDDEVEAGTSEDGEMERRKCESEDGEFKPGVSTDLEEKLESAANQETVESIDLRAVSNPSELEKQVAGNKLSEPCQPNPNE